MSVQVNVQRFSRDKRLQSEDVIQEEVAPPIEEPAKPKRKARAKKTLATPEPAAEPVAPEPEEHPSFEEMSQPFDDSFLDDLKTKPNPPMEPVPPAAPPKSEPQPEPQDTEYDDADPFAFIEGKTPNTRKPRAATKKKRDAAQTDFPDDDDLRSMISNKPSRAAPKTTKHDPDFKDLMDKKGSAILGKDKRELLVKIQQYKQLFPDELASFKIKQNASAEELQQYLDECDVIVGCSAMESFATDSILTGIQVVEGVSARTSSMNITGTSQMLKANPKFHKLVKQLYLKYGVFSQIPPEMQLLMLISTTAMVARNKNMGLHSELNQFLDQPISG